MSRYLVNLKKGNDYLVPFSFACVDTTNLIASGSYNTRNITYTATQDCYVMLYAYETDLIQIDGVKLLDSSYSGRFDGFIPLKQGQAIKINSPNGSEYKIFGLKF